MSGAPGAREGRAGLLLHHQVKTLDSQFAIYREITCDQARLDDLARAPEQVARVLRSCITHSRPVYLEVPRDLVFQPCEQVVPLPPAELDQDAVVACADEVMTRLERARSPVLMVGVEVRRFGLEKLVGELARRLHVPVVTSFMGRGLLAQGDTPVLGTYMGIAGQPDLTHLVEESDCLLLFGVILSDTNLGVSEQRITPRSAISARDGAVSMAWHQYHGVPLAALVEEMLRRVGPRQPRAEGNTPDHPKGLVADASPIEPTDIARAVNDLFARHGRMPMAADVGDCLFTALDIEHTEIAAPGYYATMGFGVPAALGLQAASGRRPIVLVGDGAFQMTGWELGNCRRYGWDPIVIVFNNQSWEMLRVFQPESRFNALDDWNFAALAEPMGGEGIRVSTRAELSAGLERAWQRPGRFQIVEVMLPKGAVSNTLARFVAGLKKTH
jgi:indolepyruvate decarboxylase